MSGLTTMSSGLVHEPLLDQIVCQQTHFVNSKGLLFGLDILQYSMPLLMAQIICIILTTRFIYHFLKPLHQGIISAHVIAGIVLGPSLLGRNTAYLNKFLPAAGKVPLQTISTIGYTLHLFLLGVKIDPSILRKAGAKAILIGVSSFALPFTLGNLIVLAISYTYDLNPLLRFCLGSTVVLNSMSSFPVITTVLAELKILNSELGRLATNTSMVGEACGWITAIFFTFHSNGISMLTFWSFSWNFAFLLVIFFIFRPLIIWLTERAPKINEKDEIPFFMILVVFLLTALASEVLGMRAGFGAFWLGVALPAGPPLGVGLSKKLDAIATTLLLPVFIAISGLQTNFFLLKWRETYLTATVIFVTHAGRVSGTLVAALYCSMPFSDAFSLALIMSCQGVIEISVCMMWNDAKVLDPTCFNLLIIMILVLTGVSRPLILYLYDPSKRYRTKSKRTILHTRQRNLQLRLLVCVYCQDNVPTIVNLVEVSNPTRYSPICVFTLHLIDLKGRAHSVLIPHHQMNKLDPNAVRSEQIVGAFQRFEQQHQGSLMAQHFTAIAPYASMHDDICTLALDKKATIIILPFHKRYAIDGSVDSVNHSIRNINQNVLEKAPCSVGILIDRSEINGNRSVLTGQTAYNVALLFFGGTDDIDALAYCIRMAEHPNVNVTVIQFKHKGYRDEKGNNDVGQQLINEFRAYSSTKGKVVFREEIVKDGMDTTQVIGSLGIDYDLVIVGRYQDMDSALLLGLTEWSECPELGIIGDLLASSDFHFSVLVVHRQPGEINALETSCKFPIQNPKSVDSRVYPRFHLEENYTAIQIRKGAET